PDPAGKRAGGLEAGGLSTHLQHGGGFDSGLRSWQGARRFTGRTRAHRRPPVFPLVRSIKIVVKAEWGAKRTCPKCGTRFYDLGKDDPVTCIECGVSWEPDPILKSKQPLPFDT